METPEWLPSAAEANAAIRVFAAGRTVWSLADLEELDRLRQVWVAAVRAEAVRRELVAAA